MGIRNIKSIPIIHSYPILVIVIAIGIISALLEALNYLAVSRLLLVSCSIGIVARLARSIFRSFREGRYGVDILAAVAIASTIVVGEYWAALIIALMLTGGEALEDYAATRAKRELDILIKRAPRIAHVSKNGKVINVKLSKVAASDTLLVKPGEVLPVDATLETDIAEFDESSLTGEALPVEHRKGDTLLSGSVNGNTAIFIKATKNAAESQYQQIIELVKAAVSSQAPFVRLADRYAIPFTIIAFLIAGIAWLISGNPLHFAEVLVVATPCPLLIGAPTAFISGMSRAAKNGIIIKSGAILEKLADVRAVAFDKTGTLTIGQPLVTAIHANGKHSSEELLLYAASVEQHSTHVLSRALIDESIKQKIKLIEPKNSREITAQGIQAEVKKDFVLVGKATFLQTEGVVIPKTHIQSGEMSIYVAINKKYIGYITFSDVARKESKAAVKQLHHLGIFDTLMLTGDTLATATRIASEVGISKIKANALPIDKVNAIKALRIRPILMIGDGINDAPVLAAADVGMAMGARGSTAATETADVVVLIDDITKGPLAIEIARNTMSIALQTIWIGIIISIVLMLIAATGIIPPIIGAILQEVVDVLVIVNALRAHK